MSQNQSSPAAVREERSMLPQLQRCWNAQEPVVVSVNGKEFQIGDAGAFDRLVGLIDWMETIEAVKEAYESVQRGEGLPLDEAFTKLRHQYGLSD